MSERALFDTRTFTVTTAQLKTKLFKEPKGPSRSAPSGRDFKPKAAKLSVDAKLFAVQNFYIGYIRALDRRNGIAIERDVIFEWIKKASGNKYTVSVFINPNFGDGDGGGGGSQQNPPPSGSKPPSL